MSVKTDESGNRYRFKNGKFEVCKVGTKNYKKINESDVPSGIREQLVDGKSNVIFGSSGSSTSSKPEDDATTKKTKHQSSVHTKRGYIGHSPPIRTSGQYNRKVQKDMSFKGTVREFDIVETVDGKPAPADKIINVYYDSIRVYNEDDGYEVDKNIIREALYGAIPTTDKNGKKMIFPKYARWLAHENEARKKANLDPSKHGYTSRDSEIAKEEKFKADVKRIRKKYAELYPGAKLSENDIRAIINNKGVVPDELLRELERFKPRDKKGAATTARKSAKKKVSTTRKKTVTRARKTTKKITPKIKKETSPKTKAKKTVKRTTKVIKPKSTKKRVIKRR